MHELQEAEPRLDGLPEPHVVGDEEPGPRLREDPQDRGHLVGLERDPPVPGAPERVVPDGGEGQRPVRGEPWPDGSELRGVEPELLGGERGDALGRGDDGQGPPAVPAGREELQEVLAGGDLLHPLDPPGAIPDGHPVALSEGEVHVAQEDSGWA